MSPEQLESSSRHTPRTDVFGLGAILYAILTGGPPYRRTADGESFRDVITDCKFLRPSKRLAKVDRSLEAICLKAMSRIPADRYETAKLLADDLRRWLADEPNSAFREPWISKLHRTCRRHKTIVTAGFVATLLVAISSTISSRLISREKQQADNNYRIARSAVEKMLAEVGSIDLAEIPQAEQIRRSLLTSATEFYETFLEEHSEDQRLQADTATAHMGLGEILEILGTYEDSEKHFRSAISLLGGIQHAGPKISSPQLIGAMERYAKLLKKTGRLEESANILHILISHHSSLSTSADKKDLLESQYQLATLLARMPGRSTEAERLYRDVAAKMTEMISGETNDSLKRFSLAKDLNNLGILMTSQQDHVGARDCFERARRVIDSLVTESPKSPQYRWLFARIENNKGATLAADSQIEGAKLSYEHGLKLLQELNAEYPSIPDYRSELATVQANLGRIFRQEGAPQRAAELFELSIKTQARLIEASPQRPDYRHRLAMTRVDLGTTRDETDPQGARVLFEQAIQDFRQLCSSYSMAAAYHAGLGTACYELFVLENREGRYETAAQVINAATESHIRALQIEPSSNSHMKAASRDLESLARLCLRSGNTDEASKSALRLAAIHPEDKGQQLIAASILSSCYSIVKADRRLEISDKAAKLIELTTQTVGVLARLAKSGFQLSETDLSSPEFSDIQSERSFQQLLNKGQAKAL